MTKSFEELSAQSRAMWSEAEWKFYDVVSEYFQKEMRDRAELGKALHAARKAKALTQPRLSEIADIQQAEISRIERGVGNPTATTLFRLTAALGLKLALIPAEKPQVPRP